MIYRHSRRDSFTLFSLSELLKGKKHDLFSQTSVSE